MDKDWLKEVMNWKTMKSNKLDIKIGDIVEFADQYDKWRVWIVDRITKHKNHIEVEYVEAQGLSELFLPRRCKRTFVVGVDYEECDN